MLSLFCVRFIFYTTFTLDVVFISGMCKTRFFTLKLRLSESQKLRLRLWMMVSNFETETFPSWSLVLRLRLMNLVSNFETVTETLVFWFQSLGPRLRPAKSQIWRLRLFCVDLRLYTFFVAMGQIKVWLLLTRYQNYQLKMVLKTCLYNLAKIRPGSQLLTFVPGRIAVFTHMRKQERILMWNNQSSSMRNVSFFLTRNQGRFLIVKK